jgi:hypothetical protein
MTLFLDTINGLYMQYFHPGKSICVDETILYFKGGIWFEQYMLWKPSAKWSIMNGLYVTTEFLSKFSTCVGKGTNSDGVVIR